jgi:hypothetical protein
MSLKVTSDWSDVDHELVRVEKAPSIESTTALDAALKALFEETQAAVHVITGSLKNSGKTSTKTHRYMWVGEITYGGASPGFPHNPVRYAWYEQRRGGGHDFMALVNTDIGNDAMLTAVEIALEG